MEIPFLEAWRRRHGERVAPGGPPDPAALASMLAECELLRARVQGYGVELDDTPDSLAAIDQLPPRWRDDPEELPWFGNDAGLYLGTVVVRTVPGASWRLTAGGRPVVRLDSGRELDVVAAGLEWAAGGSPELSQVYAEAAEA
ncbi:hypothetical protein C6N75_23605 [Streptomyces solincola]|uniref:Uncharacterized protein n=1 Tax=Streptomyces solincola TaxID=2100817 RepID=A0A2S9PR51_9ACTN|nr:DUF6278 family protein [Streptomyces solincola]PRH76817.1 hypothetical protein C6N75_23605 [Streptomyces solincola]